MRAALLRIAEERGHWAGIPMPLDGEQLVVEPSYPYAEGLMKVGAKTEEELDARAVAAGRIKLRSTFWSSHMRCEVGVVEDHDGKARGIRLSFPHTLDQQLRTMGCSEAWGIEQEAKALDLLGNLLPHLQFKQYLLAGAFLETSKRSGITYMFRKLRPTVAIGRTKDGQQLRILAALCMHPIAYYHGSWAGAMCPTDDVVAHLMMMRGDEPMFWKRCNQHPAHHPLTGLQ